MEITAFVAEIVIFSSLWQFMKYSPAIINWVPILQLLFIVNVNNLAVGFIFSQQLCLPLDYFVDTLVTADGINKTTQWEKYENNIEF